MMKKTAIALALLLCAQAQAQEQDSGKRSELWLATGFATYHFQSDKDLNGQNPGVGIEYRFSDVAAVTAGRFYNSDRDHSKYVGVYYQPWSYRGVKMGAVVGAFDGYPNMRDGGWFPALIPTATYEYKRVGVNLAVIPTYKNRLHGGISLQLKFRLF
ncbi:hypothetical protein HHL21_02975 [Massilia sp. RP-1-19]|uniref:Sn-glycerol-3-phosphate transporter n=1 Tax=Massilia polaris TaxID=2728846 RepID=A0A848HLE5_9BURK|nr:hypothetical protein [Massilia polaris]NML60063.1 hypothetical protein [Massilia polaris]